MERYESSGTDELYYLAAIREDGKIVPQFNGKAVHWLRAHERMERFEDMKKYWIGKRKFPIKSLKLIEVTNKWHKIVEYESEVTREEKEILL